MQIKNKRRQICIGDRDIDQRYRASEQAFLDLPERREIVLRFRADEDYLSRELGDRQLIVGLNGQAFRFEQQ